MVFNVRLFNVQFPYIICKKQDESGIS